MTTTFSIPGQPEYRKDLHEGEHGTVTGYADANGKKVIIKMKVSVPNGKKKEITHTCNPGNLSLRSEWELQKAIKDGTSNPKDPNDPKTKEEQKKKDSQSEQPAPVWLQDSDPDDVALQTNWEKIVLDNASICDVTKKWFSDSRVAVGLENLWLSGYLPSYAPTDLHIVTRNKNGNKSSELWTARDFNEGELILAPMTHTTRISHLHNFNHAVVGFPKRGKGAYPGATESVEVGLDGRSRGIVCNAGSLQAAADQTGGLFWLIGRTSENSEANMAWESISWNLDVTFTNMPRKKAKLTSGWVATELPVIPILTNKKAIKAGIRLLAYQKKKEKK